MRTTEQFHVKKMYETNEGKTFITREQVKAETMIVAAFKAERERIMEEIKRGEKITILTIEMI